MIISLSNSRRVDTETDLTPHERHILQKMFAARDLAATLWEFRDKKQMAFKNGWNDSGPVRERDIMAMIIDDLEKQFLQRLQAEKQSAAEKNPSAS